VRRGTSVANGIAPTFLVPKKTMLAGSQRDCHALGFPPGVLP
jgi:hypothetical protein